MPDFKYEIEEHIGVITETPKGWRLELNKISWDGKPTKYDLRSWSPDRSRIGKGITLTSKEILKLKELLNEEVS